MLQVRTARTAILVLTLCFVGYGQIVNSGGGGSGSGGTCGALGGDVSGTCDANTVDKIKGGAVPVSATVVGTNASAQPVAATTTGTGTTVMLSVSPAMTGNPTAPTQTAGNNSTRLATTAYVDAKATPGFVLLEEHTASSSASLDFNTRNVTGQSGATFQSDYDEYEIHIVSMFPATDGTSIQMLMSANGGGSYDTSGVYQNNLGLAANSSAAGTEALNQTSMSFGSNQSNNASYGSSFKLTIANPLSALFKPVYGNGTTFDSSAGKPVVYYFGNYYGAVTTVNAFQVKYSSGNIAVGTIRVYGIAK